MSETIYEHLGGIDALRRLTRCSTRKVRVDPELEPLFGAMPDEHPERVALWLAEVFGGPREYTAERGGYPAMVLAHINRGITRGPARALGGAALRLARRGGPAGRRALPADVPLVRRVGHADRAAQLADRLHAAARGPRADVAMGGRTGRVTQYDFGMPRTCWPRYARIRLLWIGALM